MDAVRAIAKTPAIASTPPTPATARRVGGMCRRTSAATATWTKNTIAIHSWRNMAWRSIISLNMRRRSRKWLTHETECVPELRWQLRTGPALLRTAPRRTDHDDDAARRADRPTGHLARVGAVDSIRDDRSRRDAVDGVRRCAGSFSADAERVPLADRRLANRSGARLAA